MKLWKRIAIVLLSMLLVVPNTSSAVFALEEDQTEEVYLEESRAEDAFEMGQTSLSEEDLPEIKDEALNSAEEGSCDPGLIESNAPDIQDEVPTNLS